ncbi:hypothetical protein ACWFR1_17090 [Streptomyces sp. NPDC055103]
MRLVRAAATLLGIGLLAWACSASPSRYTESCSTGEVSAQLRAKYSLGDLPEFKSLKFCEKEDRDGFSANMSFVADPTESIAYLASLGMRRQDFVQASPEEVSRLSRAEGEGWKLHDGEPYLTNSRSRDWNGKCLVDYLAFVPERKEWDGQVFMGMYCQE